MKKFFVATTITLFAATSAFAQLGQAASDAGEAVNQKVEQKQAENAAAKSGPVGKVVNGTKAQYHKAQSKRHAEKAKKNVKKALD